ncbi:MAG: hypothetical protein AB2810_13745 [Candidatus Thiodiazotropha endolucinida]
MSQYLNQVKPDVVNAIAAMSIAIDGLSFSEKLLKREQIKSVALGGMSDLLEEQGRLREAEEVKKLAVTVFDGSPLVVGERQ